MPAQNPTRIPFIDGIRGYASLWVMLGHFSTRSGFSIPVLNRPNIAVDLFMIVSGFLMTQHFFLRHASEPWESPRTWLLFYLRRFFRIAPLYYVLLIPSFFAFRCLQQAQRGPLKLLVNVDYDPSAMGVTAGNILTHVSFLFGLFPQYNSVLAIPDWSLGLEMQFYAVFPFFMLLARRWGIFRFCLFALPVWGLFRKLYGVSGQPASLFAIFSMPSFFPVKLGLFLIGMLLAWAYMERKAAPELLLFAVFLSALAGTGPIVVAVTALMTVLLMGTGIERGVKKINEVLGNRAAHFLADVSYGVYLVHLLVMIPVLAKLCGVPWFVQQQPLVRFLVLTVIAGPISYGIAWILFRCVETPGIRLGRALARKVSTPIN